MDRCQECQNILPRTVDRCPVCGFDNSPVTAEAPEPAKSAPGRDFLEAIGSRRKGSAKPSVSSPRSGRAPTRIGHDGAAPLYEQKTVPQERSSDFDLPDLETETRSVAAISSRLNSNIKVGRKRSHALLVGMAAIAAVGSLGAGTAIGLQRADGPAQIAMASADIPVRPTDEPLIATAVVEGFDPAAIVSITELSTCRAPIQTMGVVVEGGTIVAPIEYTQQADNPTIAVGEFETGADVLGLSNVNDITVLRPSDRLDSRLRLATTTTVRTGTQVAVVTADRDEITLSPAVVTGFETRDAAVHSFTVGTEFVEDQPTPTRTLPRGTVVLDANGDLLGMAGNDGSIVTAVRISRTVSNFQAVPDFPVPVCSDT